MTKIQGPAKIDCKLNCVQFNSLQNVYIFELFPIEVDISTYSFFPAIIYHTKTDSGSKILILTTTCIISKMHVCVI